MILNIFLYFSPGPHKTVRKIRTNVDIIGIFENITFKKQLFFEDRKTVIFRKCLESRNKHGFFFTTY
ncbi:MAG: hypothetical protein DRH10_08000 [Deltaproteobacteria bacterium]|nr:MAG: hypothetical protein DRH10_08000 [Deltaproteobacteria bacterium]